ncbi:MAG: hypothetical protein MZV64_19620 [Ignavibacteriales bacterium]|nr:hypothetical protein [Ignavibacteriales bacterium]
MPDLERLIRRTRPAEEFLNLCATPEKTSLHRQPIGGSHILPVAGRLCPDAGGFEAGRVLEGPVRGGEDRPSCACYLILAGMYPPALSWNMYCTRSC